MISLINTEALNTEPRYSIQYAREDNTKPKNKKFDTRERTFQKQGSQTVLCTEPEKLAELPSIPSYLIPHTSYLIPHTSYLLPLTSYLIPHPSSLIPSPFTDPLQTSQNRLPVSSIGSFPDFLY